MLELSSSLLPTISEARVQAPAAHKVEADFHLSIIQSVYLWLKENFSEPTLGPLKNMLREGGSPNIYPVKSCTFNLRKERWEYETTISRASASISTLTRILREMGFAYTIRDEHEFVCMYPMELAIDIRGQQSKEEALARLLYFNSSIVLRNSWLDNLTCLSNFPTQNGAHSLIDWHHRILGMSICLYDLKQDQGYVRHLGFKGHRIRSGLDLPRGKLRATRRLLAEMIVENLPDDMRHITMTE
jgi:AraC-like DNA-binding protein